MESSIAITIGRLIGRPCLLVALDEELEADEELEVKIYS